MKMIIAVVRDETVYPLIEDLTASGFQATKLASTGSFIKAGNSTLLIGVKATDVDQVLGIIKRNCPPRRIFKGDLTLAEGSLKSVASDSTQRLSHEGLISGATVFVMDVEQALKF